MDSWLGCREYYNTVCGKCTDLLENYFRPVFKGNHGRKKILVVSIISCNLHQKNHNITYRLFFDFLSSIIINKTRTIGAIRKKEYEHDRRLSGFGASSARCRKAKHLTQEQLAEKVGISSSFMGHIERGTRIASIDTLVSICNVLSVSPCLLLGASLSENAVDFPYTNDNRERSFMLDFVSLAQRTVRRWDETESAPEEAPKTEE